MRVHPFLVGAVLCVFAGERASAQTTPPAPVTSTVSADAANEAAQAHIDGRIAADTVGGWFGRSVVIGVLTGLVGTGVTWAVAATSTPKIPTERKLVLASKSPVYREEFEDSFRDAVKSKRSRTAIFGGVTGTAALVLAIVFGSARR